MTMPEILRRKLMERIDIASEPDDGEVLEEIDGLILGEEETRYLPVAQKAELRRQLFYSVRRLDVLQELLEDAGITEIMVNGYQHIFVERNGRIERYGKSFTSAEKLEDVIQQIVGRCNRVVNEQNPIVDARLENGDRVNVVMKPVALNGPILTIRRFPEQAVTMEFLVSIGSITKEAAEFLQALVRTRYSMMIGGATGSGKTTFLNALSAYIPKGERIITIEDNAELQIQGVENLVRLEAKEANLESGTEITIRDLIRAALRMRPDRVIIGEVRGAETFELLSALNTGHAGSLSTAHANSVKDMISRLETMVLMGVQLPLEAIRRQIASGIEILVHLGRGEDGSRRVEEIAEITGMEEDEIKTVSLEENMGEACKRQANWYTEKNWRGKQDENTCGKPGKDGHGRGEGDERDRLSDLGIYRSGISRNSGNQSWDCRRCEPTLLPGVVGMHCCGSGWNRMFSHVSEKPDSETERGAVRQLPGSDCVDAHGTAFRLFHGKCSAGGGRTAGTVAGKRKHSGTGTAPDAS